MMAPEIWTFTPTPEQLAAAQRLVERHDGALDQGVGVRVDQDGKMLDEAVARGTSNPGTGTPHGRAIWPR